MDRRLGRVRMFDDLRIRTKLLGGFGAVLLILLALSAAAVWSFRFTRGEVESYAMGVKVVAIADRLDRDVLDMRLFAREFSLTNKKNDAVRAMEFAASIRKQIADALLVTKSQARRLRLLDFQRRFDRYMANFERVQAQGEEQNKLLVQVLDPIGDHFYRNVTALTALTAKTANAAGLVETVLEHGLLARLYANQMLGRRDPAFGAKAETQFQALTTALDRLERAVDGEDLRSAVADLKSLADRYHAAFSTLKELTLSNLELVDTVNARIAGELVDDTASIRDSSNEELRLTETNVQAMIGWSSSLITVLALVGLGLGLAFAWGIAKAIGGPLMALTGAMTELAAGRLDVSVPGRGRADEIGAMAEALQTFKEAAVRLNSQSWVKSNVATMAGTVQAADNPRDLAHTALTTLMPLLGGGAGVVYLWNEATQTLDLQGSWGFKLRRHLSTAFTLGEGIVGQCAKERTTIILTEVPDDYLRITSGTGEAPPRAILAAPIVSRDRLLGVMEIASFLAFNADQQALVEETIPVIALNLEVQDRNLRTRLLLEQTQQQAEELRTSEEELKAQSDQLHLANDELRSKTKVLEDQAEELRASEEELRVQREELQAANEELTEKSAALEARATELVEARAEAERRALERDTASRYKSEFLANMSHELRTPLNSLLLLARSLAENEEGTLTADQVDSAKIITDSGNHLLRLINDILDLSKVEAGKMQIVPVDLVLADFPQTITRRFGRLAESRGLGLSVSVAEGLPPAIRTDSGKLDQIMNNLVGNALKFTEKGSVTVTVRPAGKERLAIVVADTGIGIPADKLERIFVAFEQVDGSTSRSFGGTGLGLTISHRLARLLGGDITVESSLGQGSTFTLVLPLDVVPQSPPVQAELPPAEMPAVPLAAPVVEAAMPQCDDDRGTISLRDETVLIIEDDPVFAAIVRDAARKQGFKVLVTPGGPSGIDLAKRYRPTGIILDIGLPGMDGWTVMNTLKKHPRTRHIPVHIMTASDDSLRGLEMGAVGFFTKPVTKEQIVQAFERIHHFSVPGTRRLLLVEDDADSRKAVHALLAGEHVIIVEAPTAKDAIARLREQPGYDCMILHLGLPDMDGQSLLQRCAEENLVIPPVVVYSARDLSETDLLALREYTDSVVIKGARSPERLLDEVTLFLHSVQASLPDAQQRVLRDLQQGQPAEGPVVLVVDDDMRNTFALSKVLRRKGFRVRMAQDGRTALAQLQQPPKADVVLMDIMMPGMDGYETTREIRKDPQFRALPVIALTAKAMAGDREKCLEAGADDYISKPVDMDLLLAAINRLVQPA